MANTRMIRNSIGITSFLAVSSTMMLASPIQGKELNINITSQPISEFRSKTVVVKQRLSGQTPFGRAASQHPSWGIFEVTDGRIIKIKQSTLTLNQLLGYAKWWDHEVTASRACKKTQGGWDDQSKCTEGNGDTITLPIGADFRDYIYELKWNENNTVNFWKTEITGGNNKN